MLEERQFTTGMVVFWNLSEFSDRHVLEDHWTRAGYKDFIPERREKQSVLKDALNEVFAKREFLVRPLATKKGFVVVRETRGEDGNTYEDVLSAKIYDNDVSPIYAGEVSWVDAVNVEYHRISSRITSNQISMALVKLLKELGGCRLRPSGSIYWLHSQHRKDWTNILEGVKAASEGGSSQGYVINHNMGPEEVNAVKDAIIHEVTYEAERLKELICGGEIGERAIKSKKVEAAALLKKVEEYETILGTGLSKLKESLAQVQMADAMAAMLDAGDPFGEEANEFATVS